MGRHVAVPLLVFCGTKTPIKSAWVRFWARPASGSTTASIASKKRHQRGVIYVSMNGLKW